MVTQEIRESGIVSDVLELQQSLTPVVETLGHRHSAAGRLAELQDQLSQLHSLDKVCEPTEGLVMPTLGSQEGAFENVRMNYTGDQGQTIRQVWSQIHFLFRKSDAVIRCKPRKRESYTYWCWTGVRFMCFLASLAGKLPKN